MTCPYNDLDSDSSTNSTNDPNGKAGYRIGSVGSAGDSCHPGAIEGSEIGSNQRELARETVSENVGSPAYQDALPNVVPPSEPRTRPIRQCRLKKLVID
ncbi:unnamed protein product, partial [Iphiclides podalirius]